MDVLLDEDVLLDDGGVNISLGFQSTQTVSIQFMFEQLRDQTFRYQIFLRPFANKPPGGGPALLGSVRDCVLVGKPST